jgi:hypothetical protein
MRPRMVGGGLEGTRLKNPANDRPTPGPSPEQLSFIANSVPPPLSFLTGQDRR